MIVLRIKCVYTHTHTYMHMHAYVKIIYHIGHTVICNLHELYYIHIVSSQEN